jgi:hypothetical protein
MRGKDTAAGSWSEGEAEDEAACGGEMLGDLAGSEDRGDTVVAVLGAARWLRWEDERGERTVEACWLCR